jgi:hypothetical protein
VLGGPDAKSLGVARVRLALSANTIQFRFEVERDVEAFRRAWSGAEVSVVEFELA